VPDTFQAAAKTDASPCMPARHTCDLLDALHRSGALVDLHTSPSLSDSGSQHKV
jgi:hypothetical protein